MEHALRPERWLFFLRVVTLVAALVLLPGVMVVTPGQWLALVLWAGGLAALWCLPVWWPVWRAEGRQLMLCAVEVVALAPIVYAYGGWASPFALLYALVVAQAAISLPLFGYMGIAVLGCTFYGWVIAATASVRVVPPWLPLLPFAAAVGIVGIGAMGQAYQHERAAAQREARKLKQQRQLVERLPVMGAEPGFWPVLLRQLCQAGRFQSAALVRFIGSKPEVVAVSQAQAWNAFARRHQVRLSRQVACSGRAELFVEERVGGRQRTILAWPVPGREGFEEGAGVLCVLAAGALTVGEGARRLERFLPWASAAVALESPHLALHRAAIDWRVLMNATLHRLHRRLVHYLVLVEVAPGTIEVDPLLLGDAIAQVLEAVLDRAPARSQVRISVQRRGSVWDFHVDAPDAAPNAPLRPVRPGLLIAQQVVAAHGGEWLGQWEAGRTSLGFVLPVPGGASAEASDREAGATNPAEKAPEPPRGAES